MKDLLQAMTGTVRLFNILLLVFILKLLLGLGFAALTVVLQMMKTVPGSGII